MSSTEAVSFFAIGRKKLQYFSPATQVSSKVFELLERRLDLNKSENLWFQPELSYPDHKGSSLTNYLILVSNKSVIAFIQHSSLTLKDTHPGVMT